MHQMHWRCYSKEKIKESFLLKLLMSGQRCNVSHFIFHKVGDFIFIHLEVTKSLKLHDILNSNLTEESMFE